MDKNIKLKPRKCQKCGSQFRTMKSSKQKFCCKLCEYLFEDNKRKRNKKWGWTGEQ